MLLVILGADHPVCNRTVGRLFGSLTVGVLVDRPSPEDTRPPQVFCSITPGDPHGHVVDDVVVVGLGDVQFVVLHTRREHPANGGFGVVPQRGAYGVRRALRALCELDEGGCHDVRDALGLRNLLEAPRGSGAEMGFGHGLAFLSF